MDTTYIENILDTLVSELKKYNISYGAISKDGRVNSSYNEGQIIDAVTQIFNFNNELRHSDIIVKRPKTREWYDFLLINENESNFFIPINIKVTEMKNNADNLNCKLGIYYALTGLIPSSITNGTNWETVFKYLSKNIDTYKDKDYYFLIANKNDVEDFFWTSLKQIPELVPNGNNLPFQANWNKNREKFKRTHEQSAEYILSTFKQSIYSRAEIKNQFQKYIEPCLGKYKTINAGGLE